MRILDRVLDFPNAIWGEDRIFIGKNSLGVIDGSSPISKVPISPYHSQAEWLVDNLSEGLPICKDLTLPEACKLITSNLKSSSGYLSNLDSALSPCCTFAGLQLIGDTLTSYVLGDCTIILEYLDGRIEILSDNRIRYYSNLTRERKLSARKLGLDESECVAAQMRENRKQMNKDGGFWTVALEGDYETNFLVRTFDIRYLKRCLLFSDGFERLFEHNLVKVNDILNQKISLRGALAKLRDFENKCVSSEVKRHDDVSALLVSFL